MKGNQAKSLPISGRVTKNEGDRTEQVQESKKILDQEKEITE